MVAAFSGNVFSMIFTEANSLGASTAIFGLIGAQAVFLYQNRSIFGAQASAAIRSTVMIVVVNLIIGLQPQIDNWGHIGGLIGGVAFTFLAGPVITAQRSISEIRLEDQRGESQALFAGAIVGGAFAILAILAIMFGFV